MDTCLSHFVKNSKLSIRYRYLVIGAFVVFIAYFTYLGFFQITELSGDQVHIGVRVLKQFNPELFPRDYVFKDTSYFRFYTPLYRWIIGHLTNVTGDYGLSLLILMPAVMIVYLMGMFVLVFYLSGSVLIATLISLVSSLKWYGFPCDVWGVAGLRTLMTPRGIFCMLAPWLFWLMFQWLQRDSCSALPLLGFFAGLGANFHPVSGMLFTELLLLMILLIYGISTKTLKMLILSALLALTGALPVLFNFIKHSASEFGTVPFALFHQVANKRFKILFPFQRTQTFFGYAISTDSQEVIIWLYLGAMLIWAGAYLLYRRRRLQDVSSRLIHGALFIIHAPLVFLLTKNTATSSALGIITVCYWFYRILQSEPDRIDRRLLYLVGLIWFYTFVVSYVLNQLWNHYEVWSLNSLVIEQPRMGRFIYLPLFLFLARFIQRGIRLGWKGYLLVGATFCLLVKPQDLYMGLLVSLLVLGWPEKKMEGKHQWLETILEAACIAVTSKAALAVASVEVNNWLFLLFAVSYTVLMLGIRQSRPGRRFALSASALALLGFAVFGINIYGSTLYLSIKNLFLIPTSVWCGLSPKQLKKIPLKRRDDSELYDWARINTNVNSLFYYNSMEFRLRAQRSITHCWKDLGSAFRQGGRSMAEFYERFKELERGYHDVGLLLRQAWKYDVDYVVTSSSQAQPNLPIVFSNNTYTVYRYEP